MKTTTPKFKVEWLATEQLIPYVNNPKEHPPEQVDQIASSIQAFGFNDPIAIDEDNVIIEGHGRLLAAHKLGLKKVPVIQLEHLTKAQKKAYMLAHNKLTLNTGWDMEKLQVELEALQELDFYDFKLTGFSTDEFKAITLNDTSEKGLNRDEEEQKTEVSIKYQNQYGVIILCESEEQQQRVYEEMIEAGYNCKVVVT